MCTSLINMHKIDEVDGIDNATCELATGEPGATTWDVGGAWVGDDSATHSAIRLSAWAASRPQGVAVESGNLLRKIEVAG